KLFSNWYTGVHGYVSVVVCVFGIFSNILNVIVLTQKHMISSTNYILIALAVADLLKMMSYLPYAMYFYIITAPSDAASHPKGWIIFILWHNAFVITCHTIAMWLTVALAVFRYIVVCHHTQGPRLCNLYRAKITIGSIIVATLFFCIPQYMLQEIIPSGDGYWFKISAIAEANNGLLQGISFWVYGVSIKIAPCIVLTLLSALLIRAMYIANEKRARLKSQGKRAESERTHEHNRTTAMLVAVVLCFVITELPQGILILISGILGKWFFEDVYSALGDFMDGIVLINSAVNFILYCGMSKQFRDTFKSVFLQSCIPPHNSKQNGLVHYSTINTESTRV
ncbi:G-protein coupled receptor dmsr-1-like, partial [Tubulanus polymorphus]|uniref:G-protein coupled receptor dmsr-1-like n=1 Tax=Tubulanus polymorphus TaxID=672921 RepID=UPI003DA32272